MTFEIVQFLSIVLIFVGLMVIGAWFNVRNR